MRLSVIIPVYNGERHVAEALRSVLAQTRAPDEIVVVDDGSTDGTGALLARYEQLSVCTQTNQGTGAARNLGIARSSGELLAFLDADDLWLPGTLAAQEALLDSDADVVFGHVEEFEQDGAYTSTKAGYIPSAMLIRRAAFDRAGLFDTAREVPEFATWFLRAREAGLRMRLHPQVVARRRLHAGNKGRTAPDAGRQYVRALKQSLDRRRGKPC